MLTSEQENIKPNNASLDKALSPTKRNNWIIYIVILTIVNYTISTMVDSSGARHLTGEGVSPNEYKEASIKTMLWGVPIIGLILALIINIIPYKKFNYKQRYLRTALLTILTIHGVFLLLGIRRLLM